MDQYEDPADVYRVRFPGKSRTRITVVPSYGDTDLAVYNGQRAQHLGAPRSGSRSGEGSVRDSLVIRNTRGSSARGFVEIYIDPTARGLDAGYSLRFKRVR